MSNGAPTDYAPELPLISEGYPLVSREHLVYLGAFRIPYDVVTTTAGTGRGYNSGGHCLAYWPEHDSLVMAGVVEIVGEFQPPATLGIGVEAGGTLTQVSQLPQATRLQIPKDILAGKRLTTDGNTTNRVAAGSVIFLSAYGLIVHSVWATYDSAGDPQSKSHFVIEAAAAGNNFATIQATPSLVHGPYQITDGFQYYSPPATSNLGLPTGDVQMRTAGFVSSYSCPIPSTFQSHFGGNTYLSGNGGRISVIGRSSTGTAFCAYKPELLAGPPIPAPLPEDVPDLYGKICCGYPNGPSGHVLNHPTMGPYGFVPRDPDNWNKVKYDGTQAFRSLIWPDGTRSILAIGWESHCAYCYGAATADPTKHRDDVPTQPGQIYCYNPQGQSGTGPSSLNTRPLIWAYDAMEVLNCFQNRPTIQPWDVRPYQTWNFTVPFQRKMANTAFEQNVDIGVYEIAGATWDPTRRRIYMSAGENDGQGPVIHVFQLTTKV